MPVEDLIGAAADHDVLALVVEQQLDAHPLPVDDMEVQASVDRLLVRMQTSTPVQHTVPRRWPRWTGLALAVAAAAAAALLIEAPTEPVATVQPPASPSTLSPVALPKPEVISRLPAEAPPVQLEPHCVTLQGDGVVLVREGAAVVRGARVTAGQWAVHRPGENTRVFADGESPPPDIDDETRNHLQDLRWRAIPERTLRALDTLLEDR